MPLAVPLSPNRTAGELEGSNQRPLSSHSRSKSWTELLSAHLTATPVFEDSLLLAARAREQSSKTGGELTVSPNPSSLTDSIGSVGSPDSAEDNSSPAAAPLQNISHCRAASLSPPALRASPTATTRDEQKFEENRDASFNSNHAAAANLGNPAFADERRHSQVKDKPADPSPCSLTTPVVLSPSGSGALCYPLSPSAMETSRRTMTVRNNSVQIWNLTTPYPRHNPPGLSANPLSYPAIDHDVPNQEKKTLHAAAVQPTSPVLSRSVEIQNEVVHIAECRSSSLPTETHGMYPSAEDPLPLSSQNMARSQQPASLNKAQDPSPVGLVAQAYAELKREEQVASGVSVPAMPRADPTSSNQSIQPSQISSELSSSNLVDEKGGSSAAHVSFLENKLRSQDTDNGSGTSPAMKMPNELLLVPVLAEDRNGPDSRDPTLFGDSTGDQPRIDCTESLEEERLHRSLSSSSGSMGSNFAALDQMILREIEEARRAARSVVSDPNSYHGRHWPEERIDKFLQAVGGRNETAIAPSTNDAMPATGYVSQPINAGDLSTLVGPSTTETKMQIRKHGATDNGRGWEVPIRARKDSIGSDFIDRGNSTRAGEEFEPPGDIEWKNSGVNEGRNGSPGRCLLTGDEKKECGQVTHDSESMLRKARFADQDETQEQEGQGTDDMIVKSVSTAESDVGSVDGLPTNLQSRWIEEGSTRRDRFMSQLDGLDQASYPPAVPPRERKPERGNEIESPQEKTPASSMFLFDFDGWPLNFLFGGSNSVEEDNVVSAQKVQWKDKVEDSFALIGCAPVGRRERARAIPPALVRVTSEPPPPSYAETIHATEVDPRMQAWLEIQYAPRSKPPKDGSYYLGKSKTVIVHEIARGDWTWCTAWSPDGDRLAVATENHHIAVVDTMSSAVWRVRHDRRISGPVKNDTTRSIRSIAWGSQFIAIGGTGNVVSVLSPIEPYPVLHTIKGTGFVGSLHWKVDSTVLAIGSRLDKAIVVRIRATDGALSPGAKIQSELLHTIDSKHWVNCVAFSPGGGCLAVGDASGVVSVFNFVDEPGQPVEVSLLTGFTMQDSILAIEWSPDGKWLYAGGEDFHITVIDTNFWEVVHRIRRNRWVQCIASSSGGSHLAVGGVSSEVSILETRNGWDSALGIELKGLVPLSAKWHPKDQYLVLTGQNNSILAVETTNARHVKGHHLHSISPILSIEFSPGGRMAAIGNEAGVVTFFSLSGSTFVTAYELVVALTDRISIEWSLNGVFVAIGSKDALLIVGQTPHGDESGDAPPSASGFSVKKVVRNLDIINSVSVDPHSQYIAVSGTCLRILDATSDFAIAREWKCGACLANAWSPDGRWLAVTGEEKTLTIYDTGDERVDQWRAIFSLKCDFVGLSLAWGPLIVGGLLYLAYGGEEKNEITIMEIRTFEGTWETVLRIPRESAIHGLDWSADGLLAAAIGNGTVSVVDLAYLQSGIAVNEMDYNWQRQALTCFTEIRRNRGKNSMRTVRWIPSAPGSDNLLAVGGTDGELEIVDLTERQRCRGYVRRG